MRLHGHLIGGVCALGAALVPGESRAQEGGILLTFGIENRLEISRNDALSIPAGGTETANVTLLSFGLSSETAIDRLNFEVDRSGRISRVSCG